MKKIIIPLLVCGLFACSKKDNETPPPSQPEAVNEITTYLAGVDSLSEFSIALKKTNISSADAAGGLTVFAPGDESIGSYDLGARTMGKDLPDSIVKNHIVKGIIKAADLTDGKILTALSGKQLKVTVREGHIYINGVEIKFADGDAGQQIIHIIAGMLRTVPGKADITVFDAMQWSIENRRGLLATGATVNLYSTQQKYTAGTPDYTATSDANGIAHFTNVAAGDYFIVVKKGDLSNIWPDASGHTFISEDSIYQSNEEATNGTIKYGATAGDLRFRDTNQDGLISTPDKVDAPFRTITFGYGTLTTEKVLIGYEENHTMKSFKTADEAFALLPGLSTKVGVMHKELVMVDGYMSDDAGCNGAPQWCAFDQYTITPNDNTVYEIWTGMYGAIKTLNRIIYSLPTMTGDTVVLAAQARGLRAFAYLELATYFGELPIYEGLTMPLDISRSSLVNTRAFIKKELIIAKATLPSTATAGNYPPLTSGAVTALLARLSLMNEDFTGAKEYASQVIQSERYQLSGDTAQLYTNANSAEIIWNLSLSFPYDFFDYLAPRTVCPVVRLSEMYLIIAESSLALGDVSMGQQYINQINMRDGLETTMFNTPADGRVALEHTYKTEFRKEGYRLRNLVRWGTAQQVLGNLGYQSFHSQLPIPSYMLDTYPNIFQNVGY